ncbi:MAG: peptide chain release factor N(5)-glutamine methyltransferase [Pseudomonadales bacterium]|jgi:release factor glutamine methyltransferase|nr:peptide chain release factor N(5)-glutamine methyltransferase [Pseudomonadales bacterium]
MTLSEALRAAAQRFAADSAALDAQLLLCAVLGVPRSRLYSHPEQGLSDAAAQHFEALCARRAAGEPVAYILGRREFWNHALEVAPGVLIPRPETELLVETALTLGAGQPGWVADLGTGSGAIALALASERPDWRVVATEYSPAACALAQRNFTAAALPNLSLREGFWCEPLRERGYRLLVANPPYLAADDPHLGQGDLRFEPLSALVAAEQGLADLRQLAAMAPAYLAGGGWLLLEHGWEQGAAVRALLRGAGFAEVATYRDTGARERVSVGQKPVLGETA